MAAKAAGGVCPLLLVLLDQHRRRDVIHRRLVTQEHVHPDAAGQHARHEPRPINHILEKHGVKIDLTILPLRIVIVIIIIACIYTIVHHLSKFSILNSLFSII